MRWKRSRGPAFSSQVDQRKRFFRASSNRLREHGIGIQDLHLVEDFAWERYPFTCFVIKTDDFAGTESSRVLLRLAPNHVIHVEGVHTRHLASRTNRDGLRVMKRKAKAAAGLGENRANTLVVHGLREANLVEIGDANALKVLEVLNVIHVLKGVHVSPEHGQLDAGCIASSGVYLEGMDCP